MRLRPRLECRAGSQRLQARRRLAADVLADGLPQHPLDALVGLLADGGGTLAELLVRPHRRQPGTEGRLERGRRQRRVQVEAVTVDRERRLDAVAPLFGRGPVDERRLTERVQDVGHRRPVLRPRQRGDERLAIVVLDAIKTARS